jgi:hypothetical protein
MGGESKRFAYWHAVLPAGRIMVAVQQVRDRENLANEKRNPVLYRAILNPPPYTCDMDLDKFVLIFGGHHMFHVIEPELRRISRPLALISGRDASWQSFDCGNAADTLGRWRDEILEALAEKYYVKDQSEGAASLREVYGAALTEFPSPEQ